jgi:hypothetical protein
LDVVLIHGADCTEDFFRDLRDDCIAEGAKAVHPVGYPISHSTHPGFREPPTSAARLKPCSPASCDGEGFVCRFSFGELRGVGHILTAEASAGVLRRRSDGQSAFAFFVGFGHNPESFSSVSGVHGHSRNNKRFPGVAESFQVSKHVVEAQRDVASNVFAKHPTRPEFSYKPSKVRPEMAVISLASSLAGVTEWLAGIPACNDVHRSHCVTFQFSHVGVYRNVGPVLPKHGLAERLRLAERDCSPSDSSGCEGKPSDSAKEVEMPQSHSPFLGHGLPQ